MMADVQNSLELKYDMDNPLKSPDEWLRKLVDVHIYEDQTKLVEYLIENNIFSDRKLNEFLTDGYSKDDEDLPYIHGWFLVSPWLAGRLKKADQFVMENEYGNWWGRTDVCSFHFDDVLSVIAHRYLANNLL